MKINLKQWAETKPEQLKGLQILVDELLQSPETKQYVEERKLHLIDSRLQLIDDLLTNNILKG
jgi:hypothetical protein